MSAGYPNPDVVATAKQGAAQAVALGQAASAGHSQILLAALAHCEATIDEYAELINDGLLCAECYRAKAELCRLCAVDVKFA